MNDKGLKWIIFIKALIQVLWYSKMRGSWPGGSFTAYWASLWINHDEQRWARRGWVVQKPSVGLPCTLGDANGREKGVLWLRNGRPKGSQAPGPLRGLAFGVWRRLESPVWYIDLPHSPQFPYRDMVMKPRPVPLLLYSRIPAYISQTHFKSVITTSTLRLQRKLFCTSNECTLYNWCTKFTVQMNAIPAYTKFHYKHEFININLLKHYVTSTFNVDWSAKSTFLVIEFSELVSDCPVVVMNFSPLLRSSCWWISSNFFPSPNEL